MASKNARVYSEPVPIDLIFEILLRLPTKSIARCRCVSKSWASMLRRPDFTEFFLTRSCAQPQLLFACQKQYKEVFFYSSPQPQSPDDNSSLAVVNYHTKFSFDRMYDNFGPVNGLVCFKDQQILNGRRTPALGMVICNPSTGQSFTLPKMKMRKRVVVPHSFFGYDPLEKQFKVLSMSISLSRGVSEEHQVLTLGTGEPLWRMIRCGIPHCPKSNVICINGIMHYVATTKESSLNPMIVCFDVRAERFSFVKVMEKFSLVKVMETVHCLETLVNYNGKLASLTPHESYYVDARSRSFEMCVLENPERNEWSKQIYEFPLVWPNVVGEAIVFFVGVTDKNEVVLAGCVPSDPFYVFYYSLEKKTIRRVEIQGLRTMKISQIQTYVNHVENMLLM